MTISQEIKNYDDLKNNKWLLNLEDNLKNLITEIEELKDNNWNNDKIEWVLEKNSKNPTQKELNKWLKNVLLSTDNSVLQVLIDELTKFADKEWVNDLLIALKNIQNEKIVQNEQGNTDDLNKNVAKKEWAMEDWDFEAMKKFLWSNMFIEKDENGKISYNKNKTKDYLTSLKNIERKDFKVKYWTPEWRAWISAVQIILNYEDWNKIKVDWKFGLETKGRVKLFQEKYNKTNNLKKWDKNYLNEDWLPGSNTLSKILETLFNISDKPDTPDKPDKPDTPDKPDNQLLKNKNIFNSIFSKKEFKIRENSDANALLDKYIISWNGQSIKEFNAYLNRAKERLINHATLSKKNFIKYFWWSNAILKFQEMYNNENYWQRNVWNCYFVAALRSLFQSPLYEHFIRTSVSYNKEKQEFSIRIPLWNTKAKEYIISENLLKPQKNRFYVEWKVIPPQIKPLQEVRWNRKKGKYEAVFDNKWNPILFKKNRKYLKPINAPKWIQALETAFLAATSMDENWKVDRLKMEWGIWSEALRTLLWENNTDKDLFSIRGHQKETERLFDNFHPLTHYTVLWSIPNKKWDSTFYKVSWTNIKLAHSHAYSVIWTDPIKKTVTIVNPWEFTKPFTLTYQQTINNFHTVMGCKTDYKNWFT